MRRTCSSVSAVPSTAAPVSYTHLILYGCIHDEPGGFDRNVIVNAFCLFPESRCFTGTEFLCVSDVAYRMLQRVVFSRKGKKFPSEDRALRSHDAACTRTVKPKVYCQDTGVSDIGIWKFYGCLKCEVQKPFLSAFL